MAPVPLVGHHAIGAGEHQQRGGRQRHLRDVPPGAPRKAMGSLQTGNEVTGWVRFGPVLVFRR